MLYRTSARPSLQGVSYLTFITHTSVSTAFGYGYRLNHDINISPWVRMASSKQSHMNHLHIISITMSWVFYILFLILTCYSITIQHG